MPRANESCIRDFPTGRMPAMGQRGTEPRQAARPLTKWQTGVARRSEDALQLGGRSLMHLIPSHRDRPSDDPIFSLHQEASQRKRRGEDVVDATIGVLLDDEGDLSILPSAARAVREV